MATPQELAAIFKTLSVDTRVRILLLLKERSLCVGALARILRVSPAAVSQHLRLLRNANLVVPEKRGYYVHYRINKKTLAKWKGATERLLGEGPD